MEPCLLLVFSHSFPSPWGSCLPQEHAHASPGGLLSWGIHEDGRASPGNSQECEAWGGRGALPRGLEEASEGEAVLASIFPKKPRQPSQSQGAQECSVGVAGIAIPGCDL